jgi:putative ABC transport system permease protein
VQSALLLVVIVTTTTTLTLGLTLRHVAQSPFAHTIGGRVTHLVFILGAVLVVLAAMSAILTTWATVIDAERSTALARALGATPRQVTSGLTAAQLLAGLLAACLGIPAGLAIYQLAGGNVATANPPLLMLLAVIPCTLAAVTVLTSIPARLGANRCVADVLRSE